MYSVIEQLPLHSHFQVIFFNDFSDISNFPTNHYAFISTIHYRIIIYMTYPWRYLRIKQILSGKSSELGRAVIANLNSLKRSFKYESFEETFFLLLRLHFKVELLFLPVFRFQKRRRAATRAYNLPSWGEQLNTPFHCVVLWWILWDQE